LFNSRDKKLNLEILSDTPLVTGAEELEEHVHIFAAGDEVINVRLVIAKIINAGHVPIRVSEYAERLSLEFTDGRILYAHVIDAEPASLSKGTQTGGALIEQTLPAAIVFRPVLLNPENFFVVKVFVTNSNSPPALRGHIEGIKAFQAHKENRLPKGLLVHAGTFIIICSVYFFDPNSLVDGSLMTWGPNVVFFMIGYLMLLTSFYDQTGSKRRHG